MQKVEGSSPFSRSRRSPPNRRVFNWARPVPPDFLPKGPPATVFEMARERIPASRPPRSSPEGASLQELPLSSRPCGEEDGACPLLGCRRGTRALRIRRPASSSARCSTAPAATWLLLSGCSSLPGVGDVGTVTAWHRRQRFPAAAAVLAATSGAGYAEVRSAREPMV